MIGEPVYISVVFQLFQIIQTAAIDKDLHVWGTYRNTIHLLSILLLAKLWMRASGVINESRFCLAPANNRVPANGVCHL